MGQVVYIGSIEKYLELEKDPDKYKKFEIVYDLNKIRKEVRNVSNNDEKRFSKEVKIVEKYIELHPGVSYRDAVLASLDKTEETKKEEFTEEEKQYIEKQKQDEEKVEKYLESHPKTEYREAVKIVLGKDELTNNEKIVEKYIESHPGVSYREAVLASLSESEGSAEDQEIINMHTTINDLIYGLTKAEKSSIFKTEDRTKLEKASNLIAEVKESLQKLIDKKGKPEPEQ